MTVRLLSAASLAAILAAHAVPAATPAEGETLAPQEAQTFTYRELDEFPSIDPNLIEDASGGHIARQLFEGLYNQDAEGNLVPGVALSHEVSEDGTVYTFTLRPEAKWSDGTPVTANDFVYSWRRAADPATASNYAWYIELMKVQGAAAVIAGEAAPDTLGVRAVDDHTLEVTIDSAIPYFPQMVAHYTTYPIPQAAVEAHGDQWTQPGNMVSNGAYVLSERVPQERLVMTKNPEYWDAANVIIETVTALVINDENQAMTRWQAGELDQTDIPIGQYPRYLEEHPTEAFAGPNLCTYFYSVNMREDSHPALLDVRVREALSLAIDRDIVVDSILAGGQEPAYTLTHPAIAGWEVPEVPAAAMTQEERNARAKELMAEAGYGEGAEPVTVEILYNTSEAHQQLAVAVGQMWKQTLGVETTLANMEWETFLDARLNGEYELGRYAWCADYNEASSYLDIMTSNSTANDGKYLSEEFDALMEESRTAEDPTPLYVQAEEVLARDVPFLPLYFYSTNFMLDDTIKGYAAENPQENWYAKDMYRIAAE